MLNNNYMQEMIKSCISLIAASVSTLLSRWLLGISTPEYDIYRVKKYFAIELRWYRGPEIVYQIKARKML